MLFLKVKSDGICSEFILLKWSDLVSFMIQCFRGQMLAEMSISLGIKPKILEKRIEIIHGQ